MFYECFMNDLEHLRCLLCVCCIQYNHKNERYEYFIVVSFTYSVDQGITRLTWWTCTYLFCARVTHINIAAEMNISKGLINAAIMRKNGNGLNTSSSSSSLVLLCPDRTKKISMILRR